MKFKKFNIVLALILCLCTMLSPVAAKADDAGAIMAFEISNDGEAVTVKLNAAENSGLTSGKVAIYFDAEALEYTAAAAGQNETLYDVNAVDNRVDFAWINAEALADAETLVALTFTAKNAATGDIYSFLCDIVEEYVNGEEVKGSGFEASYRMYIGEDEPFAIVEQPQDITVEKKHDKFVFNIKATGKDLRYMWYYSCGDVNEEGNVNWHKSGNATDTYIRTASKETDCIQVYCRVYSGDEVIYSDVAVGSIGGLTSSLKIKDEGNLAEKISADKHDKVTFSVDVAAYKLENGELVENTNLTYAWYIQLAGEEGFRKASKQQTYSRTVSATTDGMQVYCVVSDEFGNKVKSNTAVLTMNK